MVLEGAHRRGYQRVSRVAVVVSGWPRISETFALNELLALRDAGMLAAVFATKAGPPGPRQPGVDELDPLVEVLPDGSEAEQGAHVARRLASRGVTGVHGYFAHRPASVAREAAALLGVPYGFSAHALDVRKVAPSNLRRLVAGAATVVACNPDVAMALIEAGGRPSLLPHGVNTWRFRPVPAPAAATMALLAVGRCVEKKGFGVLISAMALTRSPMVLRIVGDGPLRPALEDEARRLGVGDRVEFAGRLTHAELIDDYGRCDVVVVPSIVDAAGDRDGLPNVVLEAMASGRPVVASDVAAISTAVRDQVTGVLVAAGAPSDLASALDRLGSHPAERARMGEAARLEALRDFDLRNCAAEFCREIGRSYS